MTDKKTKHGQYVNPGNEGFQLILNSDYVDKSKMIELINARINTPERLVCISRPRRFGKSFAAQMLCAYYDISSDSHELFDTLKIAKEKGYDEHLNKYNVICFDVTGFISTARRSKRPVSDVPNMIVDALQKELVELHPFLKSDMTLSDCLLKCVEGTKDDPGKKFIFIIDEWDALIREAKDDPNTQKEYLDLLREWFKDISFSPKVVAAAYMTGILPIKKDGTQSAISDFFEFPILCPGVFAEYTGFTEGEVKELCEQYKVPFDDFKAWYDGYDFPDCAEIYNPYSVMCAIRNKKCRSYWKKTAAAESLFSYINMDFDGIQEIITRLIAGEDIEVNTENFQNDFETFESKDDVLTLLVHLGYLTYHDDEKTVRIPNEEVRSEYYSILNSNKVNSKWIKLIDKSRELLKNTIDGNSEAVIKAIKAIRETEYAPTFYNNEQALRYVIKFAYIVAIDQYMKVEELPSGHGIADVVYIPKRRSLLPLLIIELKWNKTAGGAIEQIKNKEYPAVLQDYGGDIILVGINYDADTKEHTCEIERLHIDEK
ncbi:AAA family ATPase [Ruminococcus sp.]|uniref:AAA family ATPase n=1 Tax=Ruminococcus sp. TaxID=41978 RepID=UPI0025F4A92A|nr:AAA family ATPase [Ruminococcus sp.]